MCIRDSREADSGETATASSSGLQASSDLPDRLSLIHISEPTRLLSISYAVFCLKKKRRPPRSTRVRSSAASDVYKRQQGGRLGGDGHRLLQRSPGLFRPAGQAVSYTHLRAHETPEHLVCRLLLEKKTATTEIYTRKIVGSVRCV